MRIPFSVTVPVRGIRLHPVHIYKDAEFDPSYCPREGYKVASKYSENLMKHAELLSP